MTWRLSFQQVSDCSWPASRRGTFPGATFTPKRVSGGVRRPGSPGLTWKDFSVLPDPPSQSAATGPSYFESCPFMASQNSALLQKELAQGYTAFFLFLPFSPFYYIPMTLWCQLNSEANKRKKTENKVTIIYPEAGFPGGSDGKESTCSAGGLGSIPVLGRSAGGGHGNPPQDSCLENSHGQRSLLGFSPWAAKSRTRLCD